MTEPYSDQVEARAVRQVAQPERPFAFSERRGCPTVEMGVTSREPSELWGLRAGDFTPHNVLDHAHLEGVGHLSGTLDPGRGVIGPVCTQTTLADEQPSNSEIVVG